MVRPPVLPSAHGTASALRGLVSFAAPWLACTFPYRRFARALTDTPARLGADVARYAFIVTDLHPLLLAGLPAHPMTTEASGSRHHRWSWVPARAGYAGLAGTTPGPVAPAQQAFAVKLCWTGVARLDGRALDRAMT